jgi:hypothetical protein
MSTQTIQPTSIDEVQTTLSEWFETGSPNEQLHCRFRRRANNSGIDILLSRFTDDFKVELGERVLLFELKKTKLSLNLERFLIWSAFEGEKLCLKIDEDPALKNRLLTSVFRQLSETKHPAFCTRMLRVVAGLEDDLSASLIEEATAAPTDQLAMLEALSSAPWVKELAADDPILHAKLRGLELRQKMLQKAGGVLTSEEVAELLGVSRQAVDKRRSGNQLFALTQGRRGYQYPGFQFEDGKPLPGLDKVLANLEALDPWMQLRFFTSPNERLSNRSPIEMLRKGRVDEVVQVASGFGEQGAL